MKGGKAGAFRFQTHSVWCSFANNLGDAKKSDHPSGHDHAPAHRAGGARAELGITDGMVRLSCGLEHHDDVVEDLLAALDGCLGREAPTWHFGGLR